MPLDPEPVEGGNVTVTQHTDEFGRTEWLASVADKDTKVLKGWMPHFATCPVLQRERAERKHRRNK